MDLPFDERIARLRDPEMKARILAEPPDPCDPPSVDQLNRYTFKRLYPLGDRLDYEPSAQDSVTAIAEREGRDPWEVTYDVLLGAGGREFLLLPLLNYARSGSTACIASSASPPASFTLVDKIGKFRRRPKRSCAAARPASRRPRRTPPERHPPPTSG